MITVEARRARLAVRHRLAPELGAADAVDAASSLVALHGTDPGTVYLSVRARVDGFAVSDLEAALYADRSLVKHMAMRRTLWVFPREVLPYAQAGASERVAADERRKLIKDVEGRACTAMAPAGWKTPADRCCPSWPTAGS